MTEQQTPAPEAGDEVVTKEVAQVEEKATETEAEEVEAEETEGEEGEGQEPEDKVSPAKARRERRKAEMDRLRTEKEAAEREAFELRKQLESGGKEDPAPKREDYKDYDDWQADLAAHKVMSRMSARERAQVEGKTKESEAALKALSAREQQALAEQWADQESDARARYADYDAVARNPSLPITEAMVKVMAGSDLGPDIAYHLGSNPAEAARIARMQPLEMARTLGMIEARVSLPKAQKQTQAPDPVTPVRPKATASKDPAKMSMEEYRAARMAGKIK